MEHQKIINLLDNALNQPSEFKTKNWIEINDASRGTYEEGNQIIRFKTSMLMSSLFDYTDVYKLAKGTVTVANASAAAAAGYNVNKEVIFKNCAPFCNCLNRIKIHKYMMVSILM